MATLRPHCWAWVFLALALGGCVPGPNPFLVPPLPPLLETVGRDEPAGENEPATDEAAPVKGRMIGSIRHRRSLG